jgi:ABC-type transporter Mla MlaB component
MTHELTGDLLVEQGGKLSIQVPMTMDTAAAVLAAAEPHVRAGDCVLDLASVQAVDSAALSVVLSLLRVSRDAGHRLSLAETPAAFDSLAALYGVDDLLSEHLLVPATNAHA